MHRSSTVTASVAAALADAAAAASHWAGTPSACDGAAGWIVAAVRDGRSDVAAVKRAAVARVDGVDMDVRIDARAADVVITRL
jgi:hypothetical protein